jgi:hypothetical protein
MRRITGETGIRGGDRGGRQERPLEICDDSVTVGAGGDDWNSEQYTSENGQKRIKMTRR